MPKTAGELRSQLAIVRRQRAEWMTRADDRRQELEAAEAALREAEEAVKLHFEKIIEVWHRGTDDLAEAIGLSRSEYAAFVEKRETPLQLILKRARTTTTEGAGWVT